MRKIICIFLIGILMFSENTFVRAEDEIDNYDYVVEEIVVDDELRQDLPNPYTLYIMNVITSITDKGDGKIYMGVEVYCTHIMKKITTIFQLQQWNSNQWVNVADHTCVLDDTSFMYAVVSVSYPPSGTYRVRTAVMVEDYNGYAEVTEGYSGDIDFISVRDN